MTSKNPRRRVLACALIGLPATAWVASPAAAQNGKPDFPPFADVAKDFEKVVSTSDGEQSFYTLWTRAKDGQMLAELPRAFANQKHFFAMTVAGGESYAGLQAGDMYVYWKRYDRRLALIEPQLSTRATGEAEVTNSVNTLFTDRVVLDVPIVCMGPGGGPVIDMDELLLNRATTFFGGSAGGLNSNLATIAKAKAFPQNIEIAYEAPVGGGTIKTFHYSISLIPESTGYTARVADERIGFFTTTYVDLSKFDNQQKYTRYVNRWKLEKRDPKLKLSPPKEPITYYIDNTVPVRYRRWVEEGALMWNKAFERVGIVGAVQVLQQDKVTGAHMDKDPEDRRWNFIRWLSNDVGTAIGPSRVDPRTGQILDADVVLTDGWIRHFWTQYSKVLPELAMDGMSPDTLAWLDTHPNWDPRIRMAAPGERDLILAQRAARGVVAYGGHPIAAQPGVLMGTQEYDGLIGRVSQMNGLCMAATGKALDMAMLRMSLALDLFAADPPAGDKPGEDKGDILDGIPEEFVGPLLADLVAHEVGHTLGLRHNFKASSIYSLAQINSNEFKGKKPHTGSVMDYNPININMGDGEVQGDWCMIDIGPYDMWAIEYGYSFESDLKPILARVAEPELAYLTDEDTFGPDPYARRYDFAGDTISFAKNRMKLAKYHRDRLLEKYVKDGDSWANARRGYETTLGFQTSSLSTMARWVGGAHVNRDRKGDPNGRPPVVVVDVARQREALRWCIDNAFFDESFGLTPDLLNRMTVDKWFDAGGNASDDPTWPVHDRIMGIQASVLSMLLNPGTLQRVYDNEARIAASQDTLTMPELLDTTVNAIFTEIDKVPDKRYTAREPMISSLRRNLQNECISRLIDLSMESGFNAASKPISDLATGKLRELLGKGKRVLEGSNSNLDPYSAAHLTEARLRIEKALDAIYIRNAGALGGGLPMGFFLRPAPEQTPPSPEVVRETIYVPVETAPAPAGEPRG